MPKLYPIFLPKCTRSRGDRPTSGEVTRPALASQFREAETPGTQSSGAAPGRRSSVRLSFCLPCRMSWTVPEWPSFPAAESRTSHASQVFSFAFRCLRVASHWPSCSQTQPLQQTGSLALPEVHQAPFRGPRVGAGSSASQLWVLLRWSSWVRRAITALWCP